MAWQQVRDRKRIRRAETTIGAELAALWAWQPIAPGQAVHTKAFATRDGRTGWIYTDGHIDWDNRNAGPWAQ